jgi:hypothetical protein
MIMAHGEMNIKKINKKKEQKYFSQATLYD